MGIQEEDYDKSPSKFMVMRDNYCETRSKTINQTENRIYKVHPEAITVFSMLTEDCAEYETLERELQFLKKMQIFGGEI